MQNYDLRQIQSIGLSENLSTEAVLFPKMHIDIAVSDLASCWSAYDGQWSNQTTDIDTAAPLAQLLVGADATHLAPATANHPKGYPIQSRGSRLMRSVISGRYLIYLLKKIKMERRTLKVNL